tara:strand:+ start:11 stop:361 length:351 start_codon:yes stop_codon:yes gene_type:complete
MHTCTPITLDNTNITLDNLVFTLDITSACWEDYVEISERLATNIICNLNVSDPTYGVTIPMEMNINYCLPMEDNFNFLIPMEVTTKYFLEVEDVVYGITMIVEDTFNLPVISLKCG